jgi:hypothetical protein
MSEEYRDPLRCKKRIASPLIKGDKQIVAQLLIAEYSPLANPEGIPLGGGNPVMLCMAGRGFYVSR